MGDETSVTQPIAEWLLQRGWSIESLALPSGGGLTFLPRGSNPRKGGSSLVPDIIASHPDRGMLVVECKPALDLDDAKKLLDFVAGPYDAHIQFLLRTPASQLILALGFGLPITNRQVRSSAQALIGIGIGVAPEKTVSLQWDHQQMLSCRRTVDER